MSQLEKTFPANDCSMCILSPYLVELGRHPNIEMITHADLLSVTGNPGHFKAIVKKKARGFHLDRRTGCRVCIEACPVTRQAVKEQPPLATNHPEFPDLPDRGG